MDWQPKWYTANGATILFRFGRKNSHSLLIGGKKIQGGKQAGKQILSSPATILAGKNSIANGYINLFQSPRKPTSLGRM